MKKIADIFPMFAPGLVALFFTVAGGLMGAFYQQYFDTRLEEAKTLLELRKDAYIEFFKGQTVLRTLNKKWHSLSEAERINLDSEYNKLVKNALFFIALYSSKPVVDAMSDLFRTLYKDDYKNCDDPREKWLAEAKLYQEMRQELFGNTAGQHVDDKNLVLLMFDCRLLD